MARSEQGSLHTREPGDLPGGVSSESTSSRERGETVPRSSAASGRRFQFVAATLLAALALTSAPVCAFAQETTPAGAEARREAEPVEVVVTGSRGSVRAPAA